MLWVIGANVPTRLANWHINSRQSINAQIKILTWNFLSARSVISRTGENCFGKVSTAFSPIRYRERFVVVARGHFSVECSFSGASSQQNGGKARAGDRPCGAEVNRAIPFTERRRLIKTGPRRDAVFTDVIV